MSWRSEPRGRSYLRKHTVSASDTFRGSAFSACVRSGVLRRPRLRGHAGAEQKWNLPAVPAAHLESFAARWQAQWIVAAFHCKCHLSFFSKHVHSPSIWRHLFEYNVHSNLIVIFCRTGYNRRMVRRCFYTDSKPKKSLPNLKYRI